MQRIIINISLFLFIFFNVFCAFGQRTKGTVLRAVIINGDTVPQVVIEKDVVIYANRRFKTQREARRYGRLLKHVKIVYPYAKICEKKLNEYNLILAEVTDDKERRKLMKQAEKEIRKEFEGDIRSLTFTQGKILLKLIDRQTDNTSYQLLKDYRGGLRAIFWQSVARVFGANLKSEYDSDGDDKYIEDIVFLLESGMI